MSFLKREIRECRGGVGQLLPEGSHRRKTELQLRGYHWVTNSFQEPEATGRESSTKPITRQSTGS